LQIIWNNLLRKNRLLTYGTLFHVSLLFIILLILPFDSRQVLGINVWIKPIKFTVSIILFLVTTIYILDALPFSLQKTKILSWVMLACMLFEIFCIILQSARGERSHFNDTDPIGSFLFPLMGTAISIIFVIYCVLLVNYCTVKVKLTPTMKYAVILGISIFLIGAISGFTMASMMRHAIGVADGGPGLPFTNWSTTAGDLRVSHFISLHALQVFPILGLLATHFNPRSESMNIKILVTIGVMYFTFDVFTLIQALNGQPFIRL